VLCPPDINTQNVSGYGKKKDKQEKTVKMTIFAKRKIL